MKLSLSLVAGLFFSSWLLVAAPVSAEHHMSDSAKPDAMKKMDPHHSGETKKKCDYSADKMKKMDHGKMEHHKMHADHKKCDVKEGHHKTDAEHKNCDWKKDHPHKDHHPESGAMKH